MVYVWPPYWTVTEDTFPPMTGAASKSLTLNCPGHSLLIWYAVKTPAAPAPMMMTVGPLPAPPFAAMCSPPASSWPVHPHATHSAFHTHANQVRCCLEHQRVPTA